MLDKHRKIQAIGPTILRHIPEILIGDPIELHFSGIGIPIEDLLAPDLIHRSIELRPKSKKIIFRGNIIEANGLFFLSLHISLTDQGELSNLSISDFPPGDPVIDALLLLGMQKAMLDQASELTSVLSVERQRSEDLAARISTVASFLAHDFNNHLSIINLNCERILKNVEKIKDNSHYVEIIKETALKSSSISQSLLTLSSSNIDEPKDLSVDELISQSSPYLSSLASPDVSVVLRLGALGALIKVRPSGLINCLTNLIFNSCDAIKGAGEITITTHAEVRSSVLGGEELDGRSGQQSYSKQASNTLIETTSLVLTVSDTGSGMSEVVLKRVFDPHFTTKRDGNGIGLASVKDFVESYQGSIHIESSPGAGTCVTLRFPISADKFELENVKDGRLKEEIGAARMGRILVVDDERHAMEALVELLQAEGYNVVGTTYAKAAIDSIREHHLREEPFDLLLTDIVMPKASGLELTRSALEISSDLKIILMSGLNYRFDNQNIVYPILAKPLNIEDVVQAVSQVLSEP